MRYSFLSPQQIEFGWGRRSELPGWLTGWGQRLGVVVGSRSLHAAGTLTPLFAALQQAGWDLLIELAPPREPLVEDIDHLTATWQAAGFGRPGDVVLAIGGGSAIDLGKAVAAMVTNAQGRSVREFLEGVGTGAQLTLPPVPMVALPTTAGTGSEATKNAVISHREPPFKKSLRSDAMIPRLVVVDPELCVTVPPQTTAYTGMDALTQLIESHVSKRATPMTQALCTSGLAAGFPMLARAVRDGTDRPAREQLSYAALLSGMALANSGLGLAHGVAAALGVIADVPHGLACALLLPTAMRFNLSSRPDDFAHLGELMTARSWPTAAAAAAAGLDAIEQLCADVGIPRRLRDVGVRREQIDELVPASRGNSLSGNPRDVSPEELSDLLHALW